MDYDTFRDLPQFYGGGSWFHLEAWLCLLAILAIAYGLKRVRDDIHEEPFVTFDELGEQTLTAADKALPFLKGLSNWTLVAWYGFTCAIILYAIVLFLLYTTT